MKAIEVRLVGRFRFQKKLPGDHQHLIYLGVHTQNDSYVFMKGDQIKKKPSPNKLTLLQEGKILQTMQGGIGVPHMHWCGQEEDYNFIVLQELSYDLSHFIKKCGNRFSLKTSLLLGIEIISILQYYHFKNFVHCALKPQHFMMGSGAKFTKLYIIDYSSSVRFRDSQTLEHTGESDIKGEERYFNMEFSSAGYQSGDVPSRKDDIISFLYLIAFFQKGRLPWSECIASKLADKDRAQQVLNMKKNLSSKQIFEGCPDLAVLYDLTNRLKFDEKPRYSYYKNVFRQRLEKQGEIEDGIFDWMLLGDDDNDFTEDLCLDLEIIPHEAEFLNKLEEEIRVRDKAEAQKVAQLKSKQNHKTPTSAGKEKQCVIF